MEDKQQMLPIMSNDPTDKIVQMAKRLDPSFGYRKLTLLTDFPIADDYELMLHYFRGRAGPFIDLFNFIDFGVGWKYIAKGFSNDEAGEKAKDLIKEEAKKRDLTTTIDMFGSVFETLGRSTIVESFDLNGDWFFDKNYKITGFDYVNPMTFTNESIEAVMKDVTGTKEYIQNTVNADGKPSTIKIAQDRINYVTLNPWSKYSAHGSSKLQNCIPDLRTLARFPHYRNRLGRKYSETRTIVEVDSEAIGKFGEMGNKIASDVNEAQTYLDETAQFYRDQEEKGGTIAVYNWEKVTDLSWAGKEAKLEVIEDNTLKSIANQLEVPVALIDHRPDVNRDTLRTHLDMLIAMRGKGRRSKVYTPILEKFANTILKQNGITEGTIEIEYNPFLQKDYVQMADILSKLWPTGSISNPEIREKMDWDAEVNMGGDQWGEEEDLHSMPKMGNSNPYSFSNNDSTLELSQIKKVVNEMIQKDFVRGL